MLNMNNFGSLLNVAFDDFKLQLGSSYATLRNAFMDVLLRMYNAQVPNATNLLIYGAAAATICCALATIYYTRIKHKETRTGAANRTRHIYWPTRNIIDKEVLYVHHISGSLRNPSERKMMKCIYALNRRPALINHTVSADRFTPFLRACWSGNTPLVRYMLQSGADLRSRLSTGENAVYLAAYRAQKSPHWDPSVLDVLYAAGCDVDAVTVRGRTALHLAAAAGHVSLARWLMDHGALRRANALFRRAPNPYQLANAHDDINHQCIACLIHLRCPEQFTRAQNRLTFY